MGSSTHILIYVIFFCHPHNTNYNHHESEDSIPHCLISDAQKVLSKDTGRYGRWKGGKEEES